jgi:hypothetical protein
MAVVNPNKPAGLSPVKTLSGSDWSGKGNMYYIAPSDTNAYYPGDPVTLSGNGDPVRGIPGITIGVVTAPLVGAINAIGILPDGGPYVNPNNLALTNRPSGAQPIAYYAFVLDDPNIIWEIQEGGGGTNLTSAAIGFNANLLAAAPAAGVAVSGYTLSNATPPGTNIAFNFKIISLARRADNGFVTSPATGGGAQKWWVMINNHNYRAGTTGI